MILLSKNLMKISLIDLTIKRNRFRMLSKILWLAFGSSFFFLPLIVFCLIAVALIVVSFYRCELEAVYQCRSCKPAATKSAGLAAPD